MNNIKKIIFFILVLLSFYFTEKTAIFVRSKDPIMQNILTMSKDSNVLATDAIIDGNYIIPGLIGKRINEVKSLINMKAIGVFNKTFLSYDDIKPNISLEDNKNLIIKKGNPKKMSVSFILENDESNIITYLISLKIPAALLVNDTNINQNPYFEQINNDFDNYNSVEKKLNADKINTNICIINKSNKEFCKKKKKYLVEPTLILNEANIIMIKNKIKSGDIVLLKDSVSIDDVSILISYLKSKNINIVKLSYLISEKNNEN